MKEDPDVGEEFLTQLNVCVTRTHADDRLLMDMDSNSSIGTMHREGREVMSAVGPHGIKHVNAGEESLR